MLEMGIVFLVSSIIVAVCGDYDGAVVLAAAAFTFLLLDPTLP
jgi:hypothetical protein